MKVIVNTRHKGKYTSNSGCDYTVTRLHVIAIYYISDGCIVYLCSENNTCGSQGVPCSCCYLHPTGHACQHWRFIIDETLENFSFYYFCFL